MPETRIRVPLIGGVNTLHDPRRIRDDEAVSLSNLYPDSSGKMRKRLGCDFVDRPRLKAADPFGARLTGTPCAMCWAPFVDGDYLAVTHNGGGTAALFLGRLGADSIHDVVTVAMASKHRPALLPYMAKNAANQNLAAILIACGAATPTTSISIAYSIAGAAAVVAAAANVTFKNQAATVIAPKVLGTYRERVVYANFGAGQENVLVLSDRYQFNVVDVGASVLNIDTGSRDIRLPSSSGGGIDQITAVHEISQGGTIAPAQSALLILTERRAFILSGEPLQTTEAGVIRGSTQVVELPVACGCVAAQTVVQTPYGLLWLGVDDVWLFDGASLPRRVGTKIRPRLQAVTAAFRWDAFAGYEPTSGSYRIAIAGLATGNFPANCLDQWWLDLREGVADAMSARWYGIQSYNVAMEVDPTGQPPAGLYCFAPDERKEKNQALYALHQVQKEDGSGITQAIIQMDTQVGYDSALPDGSAGITAVALDRESYNAIAFALTSKAYDIGDLGIIKTYRNIELGFYASIPWRATLVVLTDNATSGGGGTSILDGSIAGTHEEQMVNIGAPNGQAITGRTIQVLLDDIYGVPEGGWVVAEYNSTFRFQGTGAVIFTATMAPAVYLDRDAYVQALTNAMLTADPGLYSIIITESANKVRIQATAETWKPKLDDPESTLIWNSLGWNVEPAAAYLQTADVSVRNRLEGDIEISDLVIVLASFGKRPGGVRR